MLAAGQQRGIIWGRSPLIELTSARSALCQLVILQPKPATFHILDCAEQGGQSGLRNILATNFKVTNFSCSVEFYLIDLSPNFVFHLAPVKTFNITEMKQELYDKLTLIIFLVATLPKINSASASGTPRTSPRASQPNGKRTCSNPSTTGSTTP